MKFEFESINNGISHGSVVLQPHKISSFCLAKVFQLKVGFVYILPFVHPRLKRRKKEQDGVRARVKNSEVLSMTLTYTENAMQKLFILIRWKFQVNCCKMQSTYINEREILKTDIILDKDRTGMGM